MATRTSCPTLRIVLVAAALLLGFASPAYADTATHLTNYRVVSGNPFESLSHLPLARADDVRLRNTRAGYANLAVTLPRPADCPARGACLVSAALVSDDFDPARRVTEEFAWDRKTVKVTGKRYRVTLSLASASFGGAAEVLKLRSYPAATNGFAKRFIAGATDVMLLVAPRERGRHLVDHATLVRPWSGNVHADFELPDTRLKRGDFQLCTTHTTFVEEGFDTSSWRCSENVLFRVLRPTATGMRVRVSWWAMPASVKGVGGDTRDRYELRHVPSGRLVATRTVIR